jgi:hypothetical protein
MKMKLFTVVFAALFSILGLVAWSADIAPSCPRCHSNSSVIPIVYGMPLPGGNEIQEAREGKVLVGGCDVDGGSEQWYCKNCCLAFGPGNLRKLPGQLNTILRATIARDPSTSAAVLTKLAEDPEPCVRANVARNRSTSDAVLRHLVMDSVQSVREAAETTLKKAKVLH